jgi:hypothetical protein
MVNILYSFAYEVRTWAEGLNNKYGLWSDDLRGACSICSWELFKTFRRNKISCRLASTRSHRFVIVNQHIVDITATQFSHNYNDVEIISCLTPHEFHRNPVIFDSIRTYMLYHIDWPNTEHPLRYKQYINMCDKISREPYELISS